MEAVEVIRCRGHENVRGMHKSTFEITKEAELSPQGDCIVGVAADKGAADLSPKFRELMAKEGIYYGLVMAQREMTKMN